MKRMITRIGVLACCLLMAGPLMAQTAQSRNTSSNYGKKYWDEGPLVWSDFQKRMNEEAEGGVLATKWEVTPESVKKGNLTYTRYVSRLYMDQLVSYITIGSMTPDKLEYFQIVFNIYEANRREFQIAYDREGKNLVDLSDYYNRKAHSEVSSFKDLTNGGKDSLAVSDYGRNLDSRLAELSMEIGRDVPDDPIMTGFSFSGVLGYSGEFFNGGVTDFFSQSHGGIIGLSFGYKRFTATFEVTLGSGGYLKKGLSYDGETWVAGDGLTVGHGGLELSYALHDGPWLRVGPMFGIEAGFVDNNVLSKLHERDNVDTEIDAFRLEAGVQADLKLWRSMTPNPYDVMMTEYGIQFRIFVARDFFNTPLEPGNSLGFSVAFYYRLM